MRLLFLTLTGFLILHAAALGQPFTRQDTLRGSITPERAWWDLTYYHLDVTVNPQDSSMRGTNTVQYRVLEPARTMQIDLQPPMAIERVEQAGRSLTFRRDGNVYYIDLAEPQNAGEVRELTIHYGGRPHVAANPPWDGGLSWESDQRGKPFIATSCQGDGASLWWPCKDHMYDEPDSMLLSITAPRGLTAVGNGRLRGRERHDDGAETFQWFVGSPINNYGVNVNIGDYAHWSDTFPGEKGQLSLDYYVLRDDLAAAKKQFLQVRPMMQAFEHWFGAYPFYEDGFKLVHVPYLGMEHQSSVTYGNGFGNGYLGMDLSGSGWGLKFDYIIIHETGHEWFANNITYKDMADMWVHEAFTTYSESLYLDYLHGKEAASEYMIGARDGIANDSPIIGPYEVNKAGSGDMYYKGANMLHTLRYVIDDDEKWRRILRGLNETFYHQTVTTRQIEDYISRESGRKLRPFFDQYLRNTAIPVLEYSYRKNKLRYRWANTVPEFDMPVRVRLNGKDEWLQPTTKWQELKATSGKVEVDENFYVEVKQAS